MGMGVGIGVGLATGGRPAAFSPLSLSPALWLKADAGLEQTSGGTPATADGDPVGRWLDQSGNGRHVSQATGSLRPTLKLNIQNSLPVVQFDGVDDFMGLPDFLSGFTAAELFLVIRARSTINQAFSVLGSPTDSGYYPFGTDVYDSFGSAVRYGPFTPGGSFTASARIYHAVTQAGSWSCDLDGVALGSSGTNTVTWPGAGASVIGKNGTSVFGSHQWCELIIVPSILAAGNRSTARTYLRVRWGTP
jgi:hypothetical protein